jgi:hypothetical protein
MKSILLNIVLILILQLEGYEAVAQELRSVSGIVTTSGKFTLNKVKISAVKSGETAFTDSSGLFVIKISEKDVLTASASGFRERKIKAGNQKNFIFDLVFIDNPTSFNTAVNEGYISETNLQKAITANQQKGLKDYSKYNSIYELISCEIYNVTVKGSSIVNKKVRSFDSNPQVLYVVDNKIVSDISYVNPAYVKDIEFIDDVGTTLYGSRGANGVIKISLK